MKAGILLSNLLEKVGVDVTDEKLKDVLGIQIDLPEDFATKLDTELMGKDAAKAHFKNEIINDFTKGVYINIEKALEEQGLEKAERDEVFKDKSLGKVVMAYGAKLKETADKSASNSDKEKALREEVKKLNESLADYKEKFVPKEEVEKVNSAWDAERYSMAMDNHFLSKKWSDKFPESVRSTLAKTVLEAKLAEMGAKAVVVDKKLKIVKADDIQSEYFDKSNKLVTFESLADDIMTSNKFLALSTESTSTNTSVHTASGGGNNLPKKLTTVQEQLRESLKDQQAL